MLIKRFAVAACLFMVACGGAQDSDPAEGPAEVAYADMNFEQRVVFMNDVVLPQMREVFVAFDPAYEGMTCATCHGTGATLGTYAMPTNDLLRLPPTEEAFFERMENDADFAEWSLFMIDRVYPRMADLLEIPLFDPTTNPNGFSCHNCHKVEGEP